MNNELFTTRMQCVKMNTHYNCYVWNSVATETESGNDPSHILYNPFLEHDKSGNGKCRYMSHILHHRFWNITKVRYPNPSNPPENPRQRLIYWDAPCVGNESLVTLRQLHQSVFPRTIMYMCIRVLSVCVELIGMQTVDYTFLPNNRSLGHCRTFSHYSQIRTLTHN